MAHEVKVSLKQATAADPIPLDAHFQRLTTDPRVTMYLLPLPSSLKATDKATDSSQKPQKDKPPRPAGGGQPKKRKTRSEKACPEELKKFNLKCEHGPVCYAYNMKDGCKNKTFGSVTRCAKGFHVCANCHKQNHSVVNCRALSQSKGS